MKARQLHSPWQLPIQWPAPPRAEARGGERLLKAAILAALLSVTLFDRFGLRISDTYSAAPALFAMFALAGVMLVAGTGELNVRGRIAYCLVIAVAGLGYLVNATFAYRSFVSAESLLLLVVLYAPFVVTLRAGVPAELRRWTVQAFVNLSLVLAVAGIAQFFAQFFFRPEWLFDYTPLIPEAIRGIEGQYNTVNAAGEWIKSNGFFLREASMFSFSTAFALLCELALQRRKWVIALFVAALVLTYSGSGLVVLAVAMLFPLGARSLGRVLACAAVAALVYFALGDALNLTYTLERADEYKHRNSSAYCRFVQPGEVVLEHMDTDPWTSVLGMGPGTMQKLRNTDRMASGGPCDTTFFKLLFEYGLLGMLSVAALIGWALARSAIPIRIRVALAVNWVLLGGYLLSPAPVLLIYLFSAMWPEDPGPGAGEGGA